MTQFVQLISNTYNIFTKPQFRSPATLVCSLSLMGAILASSYISAGDLVLSWYISCNATLYIILEVDCGFISCRSMCRVNTTTLGKTRFTNIMFALLIAGIYFNFRIMKYHSLCVTPHFIQGTRRGESMRVVRPKTALHIPDNEPLGPTRLVGWILCIKR